MNLLQELAQKMVQEIGSLYWKALPSRRPPQVALWRILQHFRIQAGLSVISGLVGRGRVFPSLPVSVEADHEAVMYLPVGTYHKLQGMTVVVGPTFQWDGISVCQTLCDVEAGRVQVCVLNLNN